MRTPEEQAPRSFMIQSLKLENYRGFERLSVPDWGALNILVGENGSGKSAILQALAVGLSRFVSAMVSHRDVVNLKPDDVSNGAKQGHIEVKLQQNARNFFERVSQSDSIFEMIFAKQSKDDFAKLAAEYAEDLQDIRRGPVPIVVLYGVNRSVSEIAPEATERAQYSPLTAYLGAFNSASRFQAFFEWFRDREDLENQRLARKEQFEDPQLKAVRSAIEQLMPGYTDLHIDRAPLRMLLKKDSKELNVNQLSDGEKILLALVGDLARRLAIANPSDDHPLAGKGIAMIDEVDLHLHPRWQRSIVKLLPQVFPGLQFFLTTHSPIVASSSPRGSLYVLIDGGIKRVDAYGQEVGLVLDEVFETAVRDQDVQEQIDAMFEMLTRGKNDAALGVFEELQNTLGHNDPVLIRAQTRMRGLGVL